MNIKYKKEDLEYAIGISTSWREVCAIVGCKVLTGSQTNLMKRAKSFGLTWNHFPGRAHRKGKAALNRKDISELCKRDTLISSHRLKLRLIKEGIKKQECENCGLDKWLGEELVLELDHIDNDHSNNEINNLRILCPNCHAIKTRNAGVVKMADTH